VQATARDQTTEVVVGEDPGQTGTPDDAPAGRAPLGLQGTLFDDLPADERPGAAPEDVGYRGPTACSAAGITYRQLDYWARTGLVEPSVREASGSGTQRLYSFRDILVLKIVKKLLDAGISLQNIRTAISTLRDRGVEDLVQITLMSDGTTVYECTSTDEVVDLLQGGQAVFAIAVGRHVRDVEGTLAALPGERARGVEAPAEPAAADELSTRRRRRTTA
jgi:DNA-binding transcriptional MerR regulator